MLSDLSIDTNSQSLNDRPARQRISSSMSKYNENTYSEAFASLESGYGSMENKNNKQMTERTEIASLEEAPPITVSRLNGGMVFDPTAPLEYVQSVVTPSAETGRKGPTKRVCADFNPTKLVEDRDEDQLFLSPPQAVSTPDDQSCSEIVLVSQLVPLNRYLCENHDRNTTAPVQSEEETTPTEEAQPTSLAVTRPPPFINNLITSSTDGKKQDRNESINGVLTTIESNDTLVYALPPPPLLKKVFQLAIEEFPSYYSPGVQCVFGEGMVEWVTGNESDSWRPVSDYFPPTLADCPPEPEPDYVPPYTAVDEPSVSEGGVVNWVTGKEAYKKVVPTPRRLSSGSSSITALLQTSDDCLVREATPPRPLPYVSITEREYYPPFVTRSTGF